MERAGFISRGILIGGSLGALSVIMGFTTNYFFSIGYGMLAGFFAGLTRFLLKKRREKRAAKLAATKE